MADFPLIPSGWFYVAPIDALRRPLEVLLGEREYVAFTTNGEAHVLDGRCPHFGSKLARGRMEDGCLQCPLHGWRFHPDGSCAGTPSGEVPPAAARLTAYPTAMIGGHVFFNSNPASTQPMSFFPGVAADDLISAPPFVLDVEMPWWMVSANGFDGQHFLVAHDRRLVGPPEVLREDTAFEVRATFEVVGGSWRDRLTRVFSGARVETTVRNPGGTVVLVTSQFRRSLTYGLVSIHPRSWSRSQVRVITWMTRRAGAGRVLDALDVRVRANFIRAFVRSDVSAGEGIRYDPQRTIGADALLSRYLRWVREREATRPG